MSHKNQHESNIEEGRCSTESSTKRTNSVNGFNFQNVAKSGWDPQPALSFAGADGEHPTTLSNEIDQCKTHNNNNNDKL